MYIVSPRISEVKLKLTYDDKNLPSCPLAGPPNYTSSSLPTLV